MNSHPPRLIPHLTTLLVSVVALILLAPLSGCAPVRGIIPPPAPVAAPRTFEAGAASVDITPPPGYSTGAYALGGDVTRGVWTRLHSRALYLGDPGGERLALVSCELWSIPAGLVERSAEILREDPRFVWVTPGRLIVAATHTHHGPGHYATHPVYNEHAQLRVGFDPHLFEFLAQRIARSVREAWETRQAAELRAGESRMLMKARNRSLPAFLADPEAPAILQENQDLPAGPDAPPEYPQDPRIARAVDPRVRTLRVVPRGRPEHTIALAVFAAVHPTVVRPNSPLTSSDFTGVAMRILESTIDRRVDLRNTTSTEPRPTPVALFFNGAEGDISPAWWERDLKEAVILGSSLADDAGLAARISRERLLSPRLTIRDGVLDISGNRFRDFSGVERRTAPYPLFGAAVAGGTEDGFTELHDLGWKEGVRRDTPRGPHGYKLATLDPKLSARFPQLQFTRWFLNPDAVPRRLPMTVARLGDLTLATLPGEFTLVLGRRIAQALATSVYGSAQRRNDIYLVGLANAYASYFTTPEEYDLQLYEGASTIYGPWSGLAVGASLVQIAGRLDQAAQRRTPVKYQYFPGRLREFGPETLSGDRERDLRIVAELANGLGEGRQLDRCPSFTWTEPLVRMRDIAANPNLEAVPSVVVESAEKLDWWPEQRTVGPDDSRLLVLLDGVRGKTATWRAIWLPRYNTPPDAVCRFVVRSLDGRIRRSPPFTLRAVPASPITPELPAPTQSSSP